MKRSRTVGGLPPRIAIVYAALFAVAFYVYGALWPTAPIMASDSEAYLGVARDLSDFHLNHLQLRAPGYPVLLLLTGSTQSPTRALFIASLLVHFTSIWLFAAALYRSGVNTLTLVLFLAILLLPPYVEATAYVLTESLAGAALAAGFVSFSYWLMQKRPIWLLTSGLSFGYTALVRPTYQLLAVAVIAYLITAAALSGWSVLKRRDVIKASLGLLCGSVILVGGYCYINYRAFGYFSLTQPLLGQHLTQKTFRALERLPDEYGAVRETLIRGRNLQMTTASNHTAYDYILLILPELSRITGLERPDLSDYLLRMNLLLIKKAPLEYLLEVVFAFGVYWFPAAGELANMNSRSLQLVWAVLHFLIIGGFFVTALLLLGVASTIKMCTGWVPMLGDQMFERLTDIKRTAFLYGLAAGIVFYSAAVSCSIQEGLPRYRVPTDGLIVFMLFLGIHLWRSLISVLGGVVSDRREAPVTVSSVAHTTPINQFCIDAAIKTR